MNAETMSIQDIDYVLVYGKKNHCCLEYTNATTKDDECRKYREKFEREMRKAGLKTQEIKNYKNNDEHEHFILISAPFETLAKCAENLQIKIPLSCDKELTDANISPEGTIEYYSRNLENALLNIGQKMNSEEERGIQYTDGLHAQTNNSDNEGSSKNLQAHGLLHLRMEGIYSTSFPLHDSSLLEHTSSCCYCEMPKDGTKSTTKTPICKQLKPDERKSLHNKWTHYRAWFKFQPIWSIRDYFREEIALYFSWCGHLITSLWIPALTGLAIFAYGMNLSILYNNSQNQNTTITNNIFNQSMINYLISTSKFYLDSTLAVVRTFFTVTWQRQSARLAFAWGGRGFRKNEEDRPNYDYSETIKRRLPGSQKMQNIMPTGVKLRKYMITFVVLLVMITAVCLSVGGVIVFRIAATG